MPSVPARRRRPRPQVFFTLRQRWTAALVGCSLSLAACGTSHRAAAPTTVSPTTVSTTATTTSASRTHAAERLGAQACLDVVQIVNAARSATPDSAEQVARLVHVAAELLGQAAAMDPQAGSANRVLETIDMDLQDENVQAAVAGLEAYSNACTGAGATQP